MSDPLVEHESPPATPAETVSHMLAFNRGQHEKFPDHVLIREVHFARILAAAERLERRFAERWEAIDALAREKLDLAGELSRLRSECERATAERDMEKQASESKRRLIGELRSECDGLREALTRIRRHAALLTLEVGRERDPRLEAIRYASLEQMVSDEKEFAGVARPLTDGEVNLVLGLRFPASASSSTPGAHP